MQWLWYFSRAQFQGDDAEMNMLHGSDTISTAENELSKLFKLQQTVAVIKPNAMTQKGGAWICMRIEHIISAAFCPTFFCFHEIVFTIKRKVKSLKKYWTDTFLTKNIFL